MSRSKCHTRNGPIEIHCRNLRDAINKSKINAWLLLLYVVLITVFICCEKIQLPDAKEWWNWISSFNTLRPRQNGRHFADDIFKCIFLNGNVRISIKFSLKFVPKDPINSIPALVQIMAWRRPGDKPLSEPMMVSLLTHICVTRPQWVK